MKKFILTLSIILFSLTYGNNKPKVALVLSGGGAKGIAHIPTLELIDSLNISIDLIIGTSMGSIIGAMYALGHSPDEIKKMAFDTNWDIMFSNNKERKKLYFFQKSDYDKYRASFRLDGITPQPPIALTNGHNSYMNLNKVVGIYETVSSFDDFYIPFRCNAVDLLSGNEIIFKNGSLSKALRSSSSIPSVFSPVKNNKLLLVDGGVINNFPTDIADNLGADIIIGVNVALNNKKMSDINTFFDVLSQSILLNGFKKRLDNLYYTDVLIEPDVLSKSTLGFDYNSLEELYKSGYKAAYSKLDDLIKIKESLEIENPTSINFPYIKENSFTIDDIVIHSNNNISSSDIFKNKKLPFTLTKNDFLNRISKLRNSNEYINLHYKIFEGQQGYILDINIDKAPKKIISEVFIKGNKKLSTSFIKDILNINPNDTLDLDKIRNNIESAYNLDYFESIRYEIEYDEDKTNIVFMIKEATFNKLKISGSWHNYYKMIGEIKLDLINTPFDNFRVTDEIRFGNSLKENHINIYYINNFNFQSKIIPLIKFSNIKKEISLYDQDNNIIEQNIYSRDYSVNTIIPLKQFGHIDMGYHNQKITYQHNFDSERIHYYSIDINLDQIDNFLYPKEGYYYYISIEKSYNEFDYNLSYLRFDHFIPFTATSRIKFYGDAFFSNLSEYENNKLVSKSAHYIPFDRTLSFCEYNLIATDLTSYGLELNFDYKNSTTFRFLYNYIDNAEFKHDSQSISGYSSYGFGLRLESILGPLNLMWTQTEDVLYNQPKNNYFFSLGIDY